LPSGDQATLHTSLVWPSNRRGGAVATVSQSRTASSCPPEASRLPSGDQLTFQTDVLWPSSWRNCSPLVLSQRRMVVSRLPEANMLLTDQATVSTAAWWPMRT